MDDREISRFLEIRAETATWCELAGRSAAFRTPALRPVIGDWPTATEFEVALEGLRQRRRELLGGRTTHRPPLGRLLLCEVNESISSGESEFATSGFFDVDDRPPWDTWVWQFPGDEPMSVTLVSWVPEETATRVDRGIEANPYACIHWFTDQRVGVSQVPAVQRLIAAGVR